MEFRGLSREDALALAIAMNIVGEVIPTDLAIFLGNQGLTVDALDALTDLNVEVDAIISEYEETGFFAYGVDAFDFDFDTDEEFAF